MKRFLIFSFAFVLLFNAMAQEHLAVSLDNPVYELLESASLKGAVQNISAVKPYSEKTIIAALKEALASGMLSKKEIEVYQTYLKDFEAAYEGLKFGNIAYQDENKSAIIGIGAYSYSGINFLNTDGWSTNNIIKGYIKGDWGDNTSYDMNIGFAIDRLSQDIFFDYSIEDGEVVLANNILNAGAYLPYQFTYKSYRKHIGFGTTRYDWDGINENMFFSYYSEPEIAGSLLNNTIQYSISQHQRDWGNSEGDFLLSDSARTFLAAETRFNIAPWIDFSFLTGTLSDLEAEYAAEAAANNTEVDPDGEDDIYNASYQKMLSLQKLEVYPFRGMNISVSTAVIWGERFEMGYMMPFIFPVFYQDMQGDYDNLLLEVEGAYQITKIGRIYASMLVDEFEFNHITDMFSYARQQFALQGGLDINIPFMPNTKLTSQYTKIEPFVYTHYPETNYPQLSVAIDMSYTHDGSPLGFYLPPNSDEWLIQLESAPFQNWSFTGSYRNIRHGTNEYEDGVDKIYGDWYIPIGWFNTDALSVEKDFLNDGVYDYSQCFTLEAQFRSPKYPLSILGGIGYSQTQWDANETGTTVPEDVSQFILYTELSFSF